MSYHVYTLRRTSLTQHQLRYTQSQSMVPDRPSHSDKGPLMGP